MIMKTLPDLLNLHCRRFHLNISSNLLATKRSRSIGDTFEKSIRLAAQALTKNLLAKLGASFVQKDRTMCLRYLVRNRSPFTQKTLTQNCVHPWMLLQSRRLAVIFALSKGLRRKKICTREKEIISRFGRPVDNGGIHTLSSCRGSIVSEYGKFRRRKFKRT